MEGSRPRGLGQVHKDIFFFIFFSAGNFLLVKKNRYNFDVFAVFCLYCKDLGAAGYVRAVKAVLPGVSKRAQSIPNSSLA